MFMRRMIGGSQGTLILLKTSTSMPPQACSVLKVHAMPATNTIRKTNKIEAFPISTLPIPGKIVWGYLRFTSRLNPSHHLTSPIWLSTQFLNTVLGSHACIGTRITPAPGPQLSQLSHISHIFLFQNTHTQTLWPSVALPHLNQFPFCP